MAGNKTLNIFRTTLGGYNPSSSYDLDVYTRLYNNTAAVAIASLSANQPVGPGSSYTSQHGNPLVAYSYVANDVIYAQVKTDGATTTCQAFGLFEAQIVDR